MAPGIALFALVLAISSSTSIAVPTGSQDSEICVDERDDWSTCVASLPMEMFGILQGYPISLDIDDVCNKIQGFRACLRETTTKCPNYLTYEDSWRFTFIGSAIDYVCSAQGKVTVTEMLKSPCNRNLIQIQTTVNSCSNEYYNTKKLFREQNQGDPTIRERCQWISERDGCMRRGYRSVCGSHVGDFVEQLYEMYEDTPYMFQEMTGYDCHPQVQTPSENLVARLIARGLEMLKKR